MGKESAFKSKYSLEQRKTEAEKMLFDSLFFLLTCILILISRQKYPDRIPVICEKAEKSDIPGLAFPPLGSAYILYVII